VPKLKEEKKRTKKNTIIGCLFVCIMVFNATFNNIPVISWRPVLLMEETGGGNRRTRKKTTGLSQVTDKLYHIMLYTSPWSRFELTTSVMIGTDCIGSCKSNYHAITTTTAPIRVSKLCIAALKLSAYFQSRVWYLQTPVHHCLNIITVLFKDLWIQNLFFEL
jgi:hypothetical protein